MSALYNAMKQEADRYNENNDCVVKAIAIAAGMTYSDARALCSNAGREHRKGIPTAVALEQLANLANLAYSLQYLTPLQDNGSRYTPITITRLLTNGQYICRVKGHAFAVIDGVIHDWTKGRRHRIIEVWKITRVV